MPKIYNNLHQPLHRVIVIGTSGSGKTTLAHQIAARLSAPHIELDALFWLPNWTPRPTEDFRAQVAPAITAERWVLDGNYSKARDLVWGRGTHLIWLNYSFGLVMGQVFKRTLQRLLSQEELFGGNRENWRNTFLSRDSILVWALTTYNRNRRNFQHVMVSTDWPHLTRLELQHPREAAQWLETI